MRFRVHRGVTGSGGIATSGGGGGSGLNVFADPAAVYNSFRRISLSTDTNRQRGAIRGLPTWNLDLSVGKRTRINERVSLRITADFTNLFNRVQFSSPGLDSGGLDNTDPAGFGVITRQINRPRFIQLGARLEF